MKPPLVQGNSNDFQTPIYGIEPLLPYLKKSWVIWEPACGNGNIVNYLGSLGYNIIGTDILFNDNLYNYDFLTWKPEVFDCIITNPPYSIKQKFLERCYKLGKPFALLLPLTTFETRKRQKLFRDNGIEVIFLPERINFETPSGKGSSAWFATAWFTWGFGIGKPMTFLETFNKDKELFKEER